MTHRLLAAALAGLLLTGCDRENAQEPEVREAPVQTSIIREDFEDPADETVAMVPLETQLSFAEDSDELPERVEAELETVLDSPQMRAEGPITLRAHAATGDEEASAQARSEVYGMLVRDWLIENGVDEERIELITFGAQNPREPNALEDGTPNDAGRAMNRRVNIVVGVPREEDNRPTIAEDLSGASDSELTDASADSN